MNKDLPKSTQQTLLAFQEMIRKQKVVEAISEIRTFFGIPQEGMNFTSEDKVALSDKTLGAANYFLYVPQRLKITKEYLLEVAKKDNIQKNDRTEGSFRLSLLKTCRSAVGSQGYRSEKMFALFRLYVIFNKIFDEVLFISDHQDDLLLIEHLPNALLEYGDEDLDDKFLLKCAFDHFNDVGRKYPVAIYVNPEASLNQVKDFISKKWHLINKYQNEDKLYGKKKRPKQAVNDFIYEHRDLKISEIFTKLSSEMGVVLDDGHISKILSLENIKRN